MRMFDYRSCWGVMDCTLVTSRRGCCKQALGKHVPMPLLEEPHERGSPDCASDCLICGSRFRIVSVAWRPPCMMALT